MSQSPLRKAAIQPELLPCKICGAPAEIHQELQDEDIWVSFACCTNPEDIGGEPCIMHLPDDPSFYRERVKEAAEYWNKVMGPREGIADIYAFKQALRELSEVCSCQQGTVHMARYENFLTLGPQEVKS